MQETSLVRTNSRVISLPIQLQARTYFWPWILFYLNMNKRKKSFFPKKIWRNLPPPPPPHLLVDVKHIFFPYSCCLNFKSPKFHIFNANLKKVYFHSFHYNGKTYKSKSYIYNKNLFQMPFTSYLYFDSEVVNYFNYILHFIVNMYCDSSLKISISPHIHVCAF